MNIIILGAGELGSYIASSLAKEEHNVFVIDHDQKALERASQEMDVGTILGKACDWKQLSEHHPDLFIAMTGSDEVNLAACSIAKQLGFPKTICRIKELSYLDHSFIDFGKLFHVDHFICAEVLAAHEILKILTHPGDIYTQNFAHGAIQMRTVQIPSDWQKTKIPLSKLELPEDLIVGLIRRRKEEEDQVIFPHGDDNIEPGDEVTVVGASHLLLNLHEIFPLSKKSLSSVTIVGGSETAVHLSHLLQKRNIPLKIIEKDEKTCERLATLFPKATILNHNEKDLHFLLSEKTQDTGALIAAKVKDEENLLIASIAKEAGCEKVAMLLSDLNLIPILQKLGIYFAFSEKVNILNRILSLVHAENIVSIGALADGKANVVEIKVSHNSELIGVPLSHLSSSLPKDLLIAVIENKGQVMVGKGKRILSPNDTIILLTSPTRIHELQALF